MDRIVLLEELRRRQAAYIGWSAESVGNDLEKKNCWLKIWSIKSFEINGIF